MEFQKWGFPGLSCLIAGLKTLEIMKVIHIEELFELLGYRDIESIRKWCVNNDVLITKTGKVEFVYETEFQLVYEKPFIDKLKRKFGAEWEQVYNLYKEGNITALNTLSGSTSKPTLLYRKESDSKNKFLEKLKDYEKKNVA